MQKSIETHFNLNTLQDCICVDFVNTPKQSINLL